MTNEEKATIAWIDLENAVRKWLACTKTVELPISGYNHEAMRDAVTAIRQNDFLLRFTPKKTKGAKH